VFFTRDLYRMPVSIAVHAPDLITDVRRSARDAVGKSALAGVVARGTKCETGAGCHDEMLFKLFGYDDLDSAALPVAPVTALGDRLDPDDGWWLRADPVYLQADRDRVYMSGAAGVGLSMDESRRLIEDLEPLFAPLARAFVVGAVDRWYLALRSAPRLKLPLLSRVIGRDIHDYLPQGEQGGSWRRLLNESQMALHGSKVNQERQERGQPVVNSVWFWGAGRMPESRPALWDTVFADDALSRGLAQLSGARCTAVPQTAEQLFDLIEHDGRYLLVFSEQDNSVRGQHRNDRVLCMDREWIAPLWMALRKGRIDTLQLSDDRGLLYDIGRKQARRWWIRIRPRN